MKTRTGSATAKQAKYAEKPNKMAGGVIGKSGGKGRDRTDDTRIFSPLLYQLSYLAMCTEHNHT